MCQKTSTVVFWGLVGLEIKKNVELGNEIIMIFKVGSIVHGISGCSVNVQVSI